LLALINLPYNTALVILQADQKFGKILFIKLVNSGGFFLVLLANFLYFRMNVTQLVWALLTVNFISSAICTVKGWDGFGHLRKASRQTSRTLLDFGKYTTFTLIGSNLLRSADTFIISLSPLGTAAVALYSIPLKLTEIQQIPLRSFTATAFPKMSKACIQGRLKEVRDLFYTYSGAMTFLFIGISLVTFFFAGLFVLVLGGRHYLGVDPVTGFSTVPLVRIFAVYGLLLPIDRMTGITLDSLNLPAKNAIKVFVMVALNIAGDLLAVFWFRSLMMAAVASILFTVAGIAIGFHFLRQAIPLNPFLIFTRGIEFYRFLWEKFRLHFIRPT
jgi:O-antigen/teichoic acid export membrane protein